MIEVFLPGRNKILNIESLLLDINGTLTVDGQLIPGVRERVAMLKGSLNLFLLSADTFGTAEDMAAELGVELFRVDTETGGLDKRDFIMDQGDENTAAIGNGYNDMHMLEAAALSICVIGKEGCSVEALRRSDIAVASINDALDLLIHPKRLVATLRA